MHLLRNIDDYIGLGPPHEVAEPAYLGVPGNPDQPGTLPSGAKQLTRDKLDVTVPGMGNTRYPEGSFARRFLKEELIRVPQDKSGPIVQASCGLVNSDDFIPNLWSPYDDHGRFP
eukprot:COSAG02_NODE_1506_length_12232_cov_420.616088_12_plen_115_part_00